MRRRFYYFGAPSFPQNSKRLIISPILNQIKVIKSDDHPLPSCRNRISLLLSQYHLHSHSILQCEHVSVYHLCHWLCCLL